jgi:hypothetical protein
MQRVRDSGQHARKRGVLTLFVTKPEIGGGSVPLRGTSARLPSHPPGPVVTSSRIATVSLHGKVLSDGPASNPPPHPHPRPSRARSQPARAVTETAASTDPASRPFPRAPARPSRVPSRPPPRPGRHLDPAATSTRAPPRPGRILTGATRLGCVPSPGASFHLARSLIPGACFPLRTLSRAPAG